MEFCWQGIDEFILYSKPIANLAWFCCWSVCFFSVIYPKTEANCPIQKDWDDICGKNPNNIGPILCKNTVLVLTDSSQWAVEYSSILNWLVFYAGVLSRICLSRVIVCYPEKKCKLLVILLNNNGSWCINKQNWLVTCYVQKMRTLVYV